MQSNSDIHYFFIYDLAAEQYEEKKTYRLIKIQFHIQLKLQNSVLKILHVFLMPYLHTL